MSYDLAALQAALAKATPGEWQHHLSHVYGPDPYRELVAQFVNGPRLVSDRDAVIGLVNAARAGLLEHAALGRALIAAAEKDGPEREVMSEGMDEAWADGCGDAAFRDLAQSAARALINHVNGSKGD